MAAQRLAKQPGEDLLLCGSAELFSALSQEDVIDLYRLMVHPLILGEGRRLFAQGNQKKTLTLTDTATFSSGIVAVEYEPTPQP